MTTDFLEQPTVIQTPEPIALSIRSAQCQSDLRSGRLPRLVFALSLLLALSVPGCATRSANPSQARANTGYMDFHADSPDELGWDVARFDDAAQSFKSVFSELEPPAGGVLRLAFPPGHYRVRVTFLNRVVSEPAIACSCCRSLTSSRLATFQASFTSKKAISPSRTAPTLAN